MLKLNSTTKNVWNNELEVKNRNDEDPLSRIAYETMKTIIDFLYKLDQQQQKSCSKLEEKKGNKKDENFLDLKVTEKNVEQLLLASDLLIISKVEENCLRYFRVANNDTLDLLKEIQFHLIPILIDFRFNRYSNTTKNYFKILE